MKRVLAVLSLLVALALPVSAAAQSPVPSDDPFEIGGTVMHNVCVAVETLPDQTLDIGTEFFVDVEGSSEPRAIITVIDPSNCAISGEPVPTIEPSPAPASDAPLPIEVVDSGFTAVRGDDYTQWAVTLRNPNASGWIAASMPVSIDFLDSDGSILSTTDETITLVPGQTGAIADTEFDAGATRSIEISVGNESDRWVEVETDWAELVVSNKRTRMVDGQPITTGRVANDYPADMAFVPVVAVYRNKAGKIVGGESTLIESIAEGGSASFKLEGFTTYKGLSAGKTEVYTEIAPETD